MEFRNELQRIKDNDPNKKIIEIDGGEGEHIENMTDEDWEQIGHDINNNTHLIELG